jgi:hypothetical protein
MERAILVTLREPAPVVSFGGVLIIAVATIEAHRWLREGETVSPLGRPGGTIAVAELLP